MKRNLLLLFMLLGLGLSACKKDDVENKKDPLNESLKINGKIYTILYLRDEMARNLGVESKSLIYHKEDTTFSSINYSETRFKVSKLFMK